MLKHQWFDLRLHSDDELKALLKTTVTSRTTLHEWPLSCVQQIITERGQQWIYKTQTGPTVESRFYAQAQSKLLVAARTLYEQAGYSIMLFEHIDAPLVQDLTLTSDVIMHIGRDIQQQIGRIQGNIPVLFDVSSPVKWRRLVHDTVDQLNLLVVEGHFNEVAAEAIATLQNRVLSDRVLNATLSNCGLVHGDLTGDNLFVLPAGGYKLIDWTRPFRGPTDLDLVALLESLGHDPREHVDSRLLTMFLMLRINWLTSCARRWFTAGAAGYDRQIADLITQIVDA